MSTPIDRRQFLGATASTGLALGAFPSISTARAGAGEKILVAVMGVNGRGSGLARGFASLDGVEVSHVCDVDRRAIDKARKAVAGVQEREPEGVVDFRRILDSSSVDALVIATPDHWHAPATILACAAGKHVYVEKPCSHNAAEGELMVKAARKHGRVVQMGNQRRSWEKVIEGIHEVQRGAVGRVYYSRGWYANTRGTIGQGKRCDVPEWLDFDLWQGPAPRRPLRDNLIHYNWHWFWHWGTGEIGNNGVHAIDLCRWGLDVDYPIRVSSGGGRHHFRDDQETPDTHAVTFDFEGRKTILWEGLSCNRRGLEDTGFGASFHGENGSIVLTGTGYTVHDRNNRKVKEVNGPRDDGDHYRNFLDCASTGKKPRSDIEEGHKSTLLCHLGNIAQRSGRALQCSSENGHIRGNKKARALWSRDYEAGWEPVV